MYIGHEYSMWRLHGTNRVDQKGWCLKALQRRHSKVKFAMEVCLSIGSYVTLPKYWRGSHVSKHVPFLWFNIPNFDLFIVTVRLKYFLHWNRNFLAFSIFCITYCCHLFAFFKTKSTKDFNLSLTFFPDCLLSKNMYHFYVQFSQTLA